MILLISKIGFGKPFLPWRKVFDRKRFNPRYLGSFFPKNCNLLIWSIKFWVLKDRDGRFELPGWGYLVLRNSHFRNFGIYDAINFVSVMKRWMLIWDLSAALYEKYMFCHEAWVQRRSSPKDYSRVQKKIDLNENYILVWKQMHHI